MRLGAAIGIRLGTAGGGTLLGELVSMVTEAVAVVAGGGEVTNGEVTAAVLLGPKLLVTAPLEAATEAGLPGEVAEAGLLGGATEAVMPGATGVAPPEEATDAALERGPEVLTVPSPTV